MGTLFQYSFLPLHNFVKEQKDIVVAKEYYDISKTGTNFERDGFNEMMQEIKEGNIDCVIVKDLSVLLRNYEAEPSAFLSYFFLCSFHSHRKALHKWLENQEK